MSNWLLLLPPSEGKATPKPTNKPYKDCLNNPRYNAFPIINEHRLQLIQALHDLINRQSGWEEIFEVKGVALEAAIRDNRNIFEAPTLPARELYNGVLYTALDYGSLGKEEKARYNAQTLIISGLYGILRPTDRIAPYKLKAGADMGGMVGKLTHFWRSRVAEVLRAEARGKVVWNLLPEQHQRMTEFPGDVAAVHEVKFVKRVVRSGVAEWKTISHHSKILKGALVRYMLSKDPMKPKDLRDFTHPDGYKYEPSLSVESRTASQIVFAAE